jgi:hypothetical protein
LFYGHFDGLRGRAVCGWVWAPQEPHRQVTVAVYVDGQPAVSGLAGDHRPDLLQAGIADGNKSFGLLLPIELMDGQEHEIAILAEDGSSLLGSPQRLVLPDLTFRPLPHDPTQYPIELAICAIAKNEARYLLEWIAYHRVVGVEHFLIFDNDSDDGMSEMLDRLSVKGFVERVPWPTVPGVAPQHTAYAEGLNRLKDRAKWIAFIDLDEFLHPLEMDDLPSLLRTFEDAGGLVVPWRIFGSSNQASWRDEPVICRFLQRAPDEHPLNHAVKTIVRSRCVAHPGVHTPSLTEGQLVDEHRRVAGLFGNPDHHPVPDAKQLVINHYFGKSWEEWEIKRRKGRADGPDSRQHNDFVDHDRNDIEDMRILRLTDGIVRQMELLADLEGIITRG